MATLKRKTWVAMVGAKKQPVALGRRLYTTFSGVRRPLATRVWLMGGD